MKPFDKEWLDAIDEAARRVVSAGLDLARLHAGLTVEQVADRLNVSPKEVEAILFGRADVRLATLQRLMRIFGGRFHTELDYARSPVAAPRAPADASSEPEPADTA